jgi:[protein-PII] uridylyltransferase
MSMTAQRKDISDPDVVYEFARQVGDLVHLDYLYVLTVADISATNPDLWNSWRDSLLRQLHTETTRALRRGLNNPVNKQDWVDETREAALSQLKARGVDAADALSLLAGLGDEYFLRETADDIAWHAEAILLHMQQKDRQHLPLVLIRDSHAANFRGGTQIFIYTPDNKNLFAATVNAIDHLGLTIVDARIITSSGGFSLDTYIVLDENGTPIGDNTPRLAHIRKQLAQTLCDPEHFGSIVQRQLPRRYRHFDVPTQVIISNDLRNDCTVVDIQTLDHPGLLAHIGRIFMRFNLLVQNARIATLGERAEDVFFVTDQNQQPLSDPALGESLRNTLQQELDQLPEQKGTQR